MGVPHFMFTLLNRIYSNPKKCILLRKYDFSSAFSCLNYDIMLAKLKNARVTGVALNFFESYFCNHENVYAYGGGLTSKSHSENVGCIQGCVGSPPSYKLYTADFSSQDDESILIKWADDSTSQAIADTWLQCDSIIKSETDNLHSVSHANKLSLDPLKSETIPILNEFGRQQSGLQFPPGKMEILGIILDSELTFEFVVKRVKSKLGRTSDILLGLQNLIPKSRLIDAASEMLNSDLYFGAEIAALASTKLHHEIMLQVQEIGRSVLKNFRCQHISNNRIYMTLGVLPYDHLLAKQTLNFWNNVVKTNNALCSLTTNIYSSSRRKTSLKSSSHPSLCPIMRALLKSYELYLFCCGKTAMSKKPITPKKIFQLDSEHLKSVFRVVHSPSGIKK